MKRLKFVFILADDLGWCDLGAEGSTFYESPNIDCIATEGMGFPRYSIVSRTPGAAGTSSKAREFFLGV